MKQLLSSWLFALLLPLSVTAATANLSIEPFSIKGGQTQEMLIDLNNPNDKIMMVQFKLRLPAGLSVKEKENSKLDVDIAGRTTRDIHSLSASMQNDGTIQFFMYSMEEDGTFSGTSGAIIKVKLVADNNFRSGDIKMENIVIGTPDEKRIDQSDYTYSITEQSTLTITAKSYSREYGDDNPKFDYTVSGGTLTGEPKLTCVATKSSDVGTYTIKVEKNTVQGDVKLVNGTLTVTKAPLTVKADDKTMQEGDNVPELTISYSGWKNGDTKNVLTKKPTASTTATKNSPAGTYPITVSGGEAKNYSFKYEKGTLTVKKKPIPDPDKKVALTANDITISKGGTADLVVRMDYDTQEKVAGYNFSLYLPDGIELNTTGALKKACTVSSETHDEDIDPQNHLSVKEKNDGGYLIIWIDQDDQTPLISTHGKLITIKLKATSDVNGVGYIKNIALTSTASQSLDLGKIADVSFKISGGGIVKKQQTLNLNVIPSQTYGNSYTLPSKTDQGLALTWTVKDGTVASVAGNTLKAQNVGSTTVTAKQSGNDSYEAFSKDYTLTVTKAQLTVSVGDYSRQEGQDNPTFKLSYSGWKNGDSESVLTKKPTATTTATKSSPAGTYTITVSGGEAKNYSFSYKNGTLTITKEPVTTRTVTTSAAGYATFYDSQTTYSLPSGLTAQVVTGVSGGKITYGILTGGVVPKGTAVMLKGDSNRSYTLTSTKESASYTGTNLLRGNDQDGNTSGDGYHYKLTYGPSYDSSLKNVFGWYWGASNGGMFRIDGHKAWLVLPKSYGTRAYTVEGEPTGIAEIAADELDGMTYDLQGRRVNSSMQRKGIYIKNGKKTINK